MAELDLSKLGNKTFLGLLEEVKDTHQRKAAGYSGSDNPDTWANFREATAWGLTPLEGCLVRMGDKYRRVQNLRRNAANDQVGESIRDTLMDLANYALIAVCLLEEEKAETERIAEKINRKRRVPDGGFGKAFDRKYIVHQPESLSHFEDEPCLQTNPEYQTALCQPAKLSSNA